MQHVEVHAENGRVYTPHSAPPTRRRTIPVRMAGDSHYLTLLHKTSLYQQAVRIIQPLCSPSEFAVFSQILDRACGHGRATCWATAIGIAKGDGGMWHGCGLSERTVKRCINSLHEKGIVARRGVRNRATEFTLDIYWKGDRPMLAVPKRLRGEAGDEAPKRDNVSLIATPKRAKLAQGIEAVVPSLTSFVPEEAVVPPGEAVGREQVFEKPEDRETVEKVSAREKLEADAARAAERSAKKREQNVARQKQRGNPMAFETIWRQTVQVHYPECIAVPAWTKAQHGIIMAVAKKWTEHNRLLDFSEFLEWSLVSWPAVMRQQFRWMTKQKPPMAPDFRFWTKFHEEFLNCYHSGKLSKWMRAADRDRVEFLKARGMTHEQAIYEIAKEQAIKATRDEVNQKLAAAKDMERRAIAEGKRIERLHEFTGRVPVHPKSQRGQEAIGVKPVAPINLNSNIDLDSLDASDIPEWE